MLQVLNIVQAIHSWPQGLAVIAICAVIPTSLWVFFYWLNKIRQ